MSIIKELLSTAQTVTITLTSLANGSYQQSAAIDNTSDLFLDAILRFKATAGASGVSATGYAAIFAYASDAGGTLYDGGASGSNASYSLPSGVTTINLVQIGVLNLQGNNAVDQKSFSVAAAFGGILPAKWGIVVLNATGAALAASGNAVDFTGIKTQVV